MLWFTMAPFPSQPSPATVTSFSRVTMLRGALSVAALKLTSSVPPFATTIGEESAVLPSGPVRSSPI